MGWQENGNKCRTIFIILLHLLCTTLPPWWGSCLKTESITIWHANVKASKLLYVSLIKDIRTKMFVTQSINIVGCILDPKVFFGIFEEMGDIRRAGRWEIGKTLVLRSELNLLMLGCVWYRLCSHWGKGWGGCVSCFAKLSTEVASWATTVRESIVGVFVVDFVQLSWSSGCLFTISKDGVFGGWSRVAIFSSCYSMISSSKMGDSGMNTKAMAHSCSIKGVRVKWDPSWYACIYVRCSATQPSTILHFKLTVALCNALLKLCEISFCKPL